MLFLKNIQRIEYNTDRMASGILERIEDENDPCRITIRFVNQESSETDWLRYDKEVEVEAEDGKKITCRVSVAYGLVKKEEEDGEEVGKARWELVALRKGQVSIYFPAKNVDSHLRFHIHAPFASTVARDSVRECRPNEMLRDHLAELIVESLEAVRDRGMLTVNALAVLPNKDDNLPEFYEPIREKIVQAFREKPLTPTRSGSHAPATILRKSMDGMNEVLDEKDLKIVLNEEEVKWASGARLNTPQDKFLDSLEILKFGLKEFCPIIEKEFYFHRSKDMRDWLSSKKTSWLLHFYLIFEKVTPKTYDNANEFFDKGKDLKIILGEDNRLHRGGDIFQPPENASVKSKKFNMINNKLLEGEKEKVNRLQRMLSRFGVNILDEMQILKIIAEKYLYRRFEEINIKEHLEDIKRMIKYYSDNKTIKRDIPKLYFLSVEKNKYIDPDILFMDRPYLSSGLTTLYNGHSEIKEIWDGYKKLGENFIEYAKYCGVKYRILPIESKYSAFWNKEIHEKINNNSNKKREVPNRIDKDWRVPYEIIPEYNVQILKKGWDYYVCITNTKADICNFNNDPNKWGYTYEKAKLLWNMMCELESYYLTARYQYNNQITFEGCSTLVYYLRHFKWIPDKKGDFHTPQEMTEKDLPDGFPYNNTNGWLTKIEFEKNAEEAKRIQEAKRQESLKSTQDLEEALKENEINISVSRLKDIARIPEEIIEKILEEEKQRKIEAEFPSQPVKDAERRMAKKAEEHLNQPDRINKKRPRSVSITNDTESARAYLEGKYTNKSSQIVCQLCECSLAKVSFKKRDKKYYFEAVKLFPDGMIKKEDEAVHVLLCPKCSDEYVQLVRGQKDQPQFKEIIKHFREIDHSVIEESALIVPLELNGREGRLRFVATHWSDIKTVLEENDKLKISS